MANELTHTQMYRDLVEAATRDVPADSFTVKDFIEDTGMPERSALKRLKDKAAEGLLESRKTPVDGHLTWVFWFPEGE